ncbi:MAG TPA: PaaI family thioesterase [Syntrophales bacterium]|nr:PaaI family thioesterase [Syntrophales bacterium]HOH72335.1 PaaI family thioesterase [Syntrophales bacterium]HPN08348.1 PaaI family thioesterase [Syntrophales bacterium]HPX80353.1 PaaI family thioesterase [Syntrophales bacterium]
MKTLELAFEKIRDIINESPFYRHLGIKLVELSARGSEVAMEIRESLKSVYGRAHGGAIASLADSACSLSLVTVIKENETFATQSLEVYYLAQVEGGMLKAKGWVVHKGRHSAVLEADIFDEAGRKVAHAHTVHVIRALRGEEGDTFIDKIRKSGGIK